jgi:hypothetical protein
VRKYKNIRIQTYYIIPHRLLPRLVHVQDPLPFRRIKSLGHAWLLSMEMNTTCHASSIKQTSVRYHIHMLE